MSKENFQKPIANKKNQRKLTGVVVLLFIPIYAALCFAPFTLGIARYPIYLVKCMKPPIVATKFAAAYAYSNPGTVYYFSNLITADDLFCSEEEAKAAGYRPS